MNPQQMPSGLLLQTFRDTGMQFGADLEPTESQRLSRELDAMQVEIDRRMAW